MRRFLSLERLAFLVCLVLIVGIAYAGVSPNISQLVAIGDPNTPSQQLAVNADGSINISSSPTSGTAAGITAVVSGSAESNHVLKGSAGNLYGVYVTTGATAGFLMIFNATSAPSDGAVTPIECVQAPANQTTAINYNPGPPSIFSIGITAVFSSTGCFTKTASATAFFHGAVK